MLFDYITSSMTAIIFCDNIVDREVIQQYDLYKPMQNYIKCRGLYKRMVILLKTRKECLEAYGSDYFINRMVEEGRLFRVDKGIFSEEEHVPEPALLSYKYPKAVITMDTAFYLYGLTDEVPDYCTMATSRESAPIADVRVKQVFMPKELLGIGVITMDYKGYTIRIFDRERMLVELLRYKSKLPFNYYKEILGNYRRILPQLNAEKIRDYAEAVPKSNRVVRTLQTEVY